MHEMSEQQKARATDKIALTILAMCQDASRATLAARLQYALSSYGIEENKFRYTLSASRVEEEQALREEEDMLESLRGAYVMYVQWGEDPCKRLMEWIPELGVKPFRTRAAALLLAALIEA